jgi:hypothetical protein
MKLDKVVGTVDFLGVQLTLRTFTGVVQDAATHSTSHVESTRNVYGNVTQVRSVTEQQQDIWLKADDDMEVRLPVGGVAVPVRTGHELQAFFAAREGTESGTLVAVKNLTTGEVVETSNTYQPLPNPGFFKLPLISTLGAGVMAVLFTVGFVMGGFIFTASGVADYSTGAWITGIALAGAIVWQNSTATRGVAKFRQDLRNVVAAAI